MDEGLLSLLKAQLNLKKFGSYKVTARNAGLVIVDEINGFCAYGALACSAKDPVIINMIERTNKLAQRWVEQKTISQPILTFIDTHDPNRPEDPYPRHCIAGSGEDQLVSELQWLYNHKHLTVRKDCINGIIGSYIVTGDSKGANFFLRWANRQELETIVVVGICTDICVLQFVQTLLSCRNHGMLPKLKDVVVYSEACATYDLPVEVAASLKLSPHPRELTQHMGLYLMQQSGAILAKKIVL